MTADVFFGGMVLMASMSVSKTEGPGSRPGAPAIARVQDMREHRLKGRSGASE